MSVSALLPVHAGVPADHVAEALDSLLAQTTPLDEVVVVEDGPLGGDHRTVIEDLQCRHPRVVVVRLDSNSGAGVANQAGLAVATGEWIAKFDSDDICLPHRIQRQLQKLQETGADVCGSSMLEFEEDPAHPIALRSVPLEHEAIARRMRFNNPINHPTSVYRRRLAVEVGGYSDLRYMQDYDLFARMLARGARMVNLEEPVVLFRAGETMRRRRGAREFISLEWRLQTRLHSYGLIGRTRMVVNLLVRLTFRKLPAPLMRLAYRTLLSRPTDAASTNCTAPRRDA